MDIKEVRKKYPQYSDMSDQDLASALHSKYYADMPIDEFNEKVGLTKKERTWSQVPLEAAKNIPASAWRMATGLADAIASPIQTVSGLADVAAGGLRNAMPGGVRAAIDAIDFNPAAATRATEAADAVGAEYKNRYGSEAGIKETLATDPVGVLGDVSMVTGAVPGVVGRAGRVINPVNIAAKGAGAFGRAGGEIASQVLGLTTGTGADTVKMAVKAGQSGDRGFLRGLSGESGMDNVLDRARGALETMRATRGAEYKTNISTTAADAKKLNFNPIDRVFVNQIKTLRTNGKWLIGDDEVKKIKQVSDVLAEWRNDPASHTAMGLDGLKRRIDAIYPDSPSQKQAQRVIGATRNAVKDTIVSQSPDYAKAMSAYEDALSIEREIEKALSLGHKAAAETAVRKLQSLTRKNANTNYGYRQELADALQKGGGVDLMPELAGQSLSAWTPRSLAGQGAGLATLGGMMFSPQIAAFLPMQSPKAVGLAAYGAGRAGGLAGGLLDKSPITGEQAKVAALLAAWENNRP